MSERYAGLKKIPNEPAARLLANVNAKLEVKLEAPASASVETVLTELGEKEEWIDMLRAMSIFLPPREAVWWACLAARDVVGTDDKSAPQCLKASEAWVFKANDDNREAVQLAMNAADVDDDTVLCATAAFYAPGNMGFGELEKSPAPPAAVSACSFGMNMISFGEAEDPDNHLQLLIDRALDIAKGGNGKIEPLRAAPEPADG